jgi:hypothetical protein
MAVIARGSQISGAALDTLNIALNRRYTRAEVVSVANDGRATLRVTNQRGQQHNISIGMTDGGNTYAVQVLP